LTKDFDFECTNQRPGTGTNKSGCGLVVPVPSLELQEPQVTVDEWAGPDQLWPPTDAASRRKGAPKAPRMGHHRTLDSQYRTYIRVDLSGLVTGAFGQALLVRPVLDVHWRRASSCTRTLGAIAIIFGMQNRAHPAHRPCMPSLKSGNFERTLPLF
jgi:hypothetical protein